MKVLVLGGNGFIGLNLVDQLILDGHSVRVFGRTPSELRDPILGVEYQYGSFSDINSVSKALSEIDVVFHLISSSIPSSSNISPADDIRDNLVSTINLLECMKNMGIRRILFISSGGTIYGDSSEELIDEDHPLNPNCSYGIVKLAIEKYLMMYKKLYKFEPLILRASNPYGPWQGKIGIQGLISTVLSKAISQEVVEVWGNGEIIRDYLFVSDLILACLRVLETNTSGIFNIGSGIGHTVNQIIKIIEEVTCSNLDVVYTNERDMDIKKVILDNSKAKNELAWSPSTSINDGIAAHYQWLKSL